MGVIEVHKLSAARLPNDSQRAACSLNPSNVRHCHPEGECRGRSFHEPCRSHPSPRIPAGGLAGHRGRIPRDAHHDRDARHSCRACGDFRHGNRRGVLPGGRQPRITSCRPYPARRHNHARLHASAPCGPTGHRAGGRQQGRCLFGVVRVPVELHRPCIHALGLCALGDRDFPGCSPTGRCTDVGPHPGHAWKRRRPDLLLSPGKSFAGRSVHQPDVRRDRAVSCPALLLTRHATRSSRGAGVSSAGVHQRLFDD